MTTESATRGSLLDRTAVELLERFAAGKLTPGAGSAAALMGALAGSLAQAAARYAGKAGKQREAAAPFRERAEVLLGEARERSRQVGQAVDEDAAAFDRYWQLLGRLRGASEAERADLQAPAAEALRQATDIPIEIARHCAALAEIGLELYERGHKNARGEAATAVFSAVANGEAAAHTARLNLQAAGGAPWSDSRRAEIRGLRSQLLGVRRRIEAQIDAEEEEEEEEGR
ncbi:MAG TPA: cyclodeaminase/cyclohydrolase family protein [Thermoanaerobaculia bacterium]|nr:cyclodeaminase/cyclohydrolase family protein [Thermoanaerobaculia bacterium]